MQFGFNAQHTRTNSYEQLLIQAMFGKLKQRWVCFLGGGASTPPRQSPIAWYMLAPKITISMPSTLRLSAIRCEYFWEMLLPPRHRGERGRLCGSQDSKLYAFDAATGQKKGVADVGDILSKARSCGLEGLKFKRQQTAES